MSVFFGVAGCLLLFIAAFLILPVSVITATDRTGPVSFVALAILAWVSLGLGTVGALFILAAEAIDKAEGKGEGS